MTPNLCVELWESNEVGHKHLGGHCTQTDHGEENKIQYYHQYIHTYIYIYIYVAVSWACTYVISAPEVCESSVGGKTIYMYEDGNCDFLEKSLVVFMHGCRCMGSFLFYICAWMNLQRNWRGTEEHPTKLPFFVGGGGFRSTQKKRDGWAI
jgi:hypothetical protein